MARFSADLVGSRQREVESFVHIAITCPYNIDTPGGVQSQVIGLAETLSTENRLTILTPGTMVPESLKNSSVEMILLGSTFGFAANGSVAPVSLSLKAALRLHRYLEETAPDVLIIHEPMVPIVSSVALFSSAKRKIGVFHRGGNTKALSLLRPLASLILTKLDDGIVVSEEARDSVRALIGERSRGFRRIPNAVDVARFEPRERNARRKGAILFLGRHEHRKGLGVLLEAFSKLGPGFTLSIIGSGPETAKLTIKYPPSDTLHWLGQVSIKEMVHLMHESEIFVAPSLGGESFGVILLEAMAAEVPVICSDISGYRLAAENAAVFVEPGNATNLARAIRELSDDEAAQNELAHRGHRRSREFNFSVAGKRYLGVIESISATG